MRTTRLHAEPTASTDDGAQWHLNEEQSHYLLRVLRLQTGDPVNVFDGRGREWTTILGTVSKRSCTLETQRELAYEAPPLDLGIGLALLKGEGFDRALQKAVELGAAHIALLLTERGNVHWNAERDQRRRSHVSKIMISACEQSGARYLPRLIGPADLETVVRELQTESISPVVLQPGAQPLPITLPRQPTTLLIGPEGGWSNREIDWFDSQGIARYGLGQQVLRAETAPLAALAAVRHGWGWIQ